jgi:hypothetical protein
MNIFTAPLKMTLHAFSDYDLDVEEARKNVTPGKEPLVLAPRMLAAFLASATVLTLGVVMVGLYHTFGGGSGNLEISAFGIELKTQETGTALIALGLVFYLAIGRLIMARFDD